MGDIGPNPLLTLCTPLTLLDTGSATSAAIRMSILSISTAHFAHDTLDGPTEVVNVADTTWASRCEALGTVSGRLKKAALSNITLATGKSLNPAEGEYISVCPIRIFLLDLRLTMPVDSILAACTLLCIRDVRLTSFIQSG